MSQTRNCNLPAGCTGAWTDSNCFGDASSCGVPTLTNCIASGDWPGWSGSKASAGNETIGALPGPATYSLTLTCDGPSGPVSDSVTVEVNGAEHNACDTTTPFACSLRAGPITPGEIPCSSNNDCGHNVCQGTSPGPVACTRASGPGPGGPPACTFDSNCITYYYTCSGPSCVPVVGDPSDPSTPSTCGGGLPACPQPPGTCTISATPNRIVIPPPRRAGLDWDCKNVQAGSCSIDQGLGPVSEQSSVSLSVSPSATTNYTIACTDNNNASTTASAELKVYNFTGGHLKEIRY